MSEQNEDIQQEAVVDTGPDTHESYGLARFARVSGNPGRLFGSSIEHGHFIELSISRGGRRREYQRDWYFPKGEIVSVHLSPTQFAELLTNLNVGEGIPCTIKHVEGKRMADCPEKSFAEQTHADMKQEFKRLAQRIAALSKTADTMLSGPGALKASDKAKVKAEIAAILQEVGSNIPFIHECFQEAMDKTVTDAKGAVDAAVLHAQVVLGKEACAKLAIDGEAARKVIDGPALCQHANPKVNPRFVALDKSDLCPKCGGGYSCWTNDKGEHCSCSAAQKAIGDGKEAKGG